jgi:hypothetical protein
MARRTPEELQAAISKWKVTKGEASQVTPRQARLALLQNGLLSQVDTIIASLPEPQKSIAQTEWEYAVAIERNSSWIEQIGAAIGLDEAGLDDLFILAATL